MKIVIPELNDPTVQEAIQHFSNISFLPAESIEQAAKMIKDGVADSLLSGIDYPSRDVILSCKAHIPLKSPFFSSCFVCERNSDNQKLILADGGVNKQPSKDQLYTIVEDTATTYTSYYNDQPRIAMLSYSTYGSGGKNPDLEKIHFCIDKIRENHPDWLIDGEMQLDAAIDEKIAAKKTPGSPVGGKANILITPDLNSGNILYKSLERFGSFAIAGPIIQGFKKPLADLSRGSTVNDIILTIKVLNKLYQERH